MPPPPSTAFLSPTPLLLPSAARPAPPAVPAPLRRGDAALCVSRPDHAAANPFSAALTVLSTLLRRSQTPPPAAPTPPAQPDPLPPAPTANAPLDSDGLAERLAARADDDGLETRLAARRERASRAAAAAAAAAIANQPPAASPTDEPAQTPDRPLSRQPLRPNPLEPADGAEKQPLRRVAARAPNRRARRNPQPVVPVALSRLPPERLHALLATSLAQARSTSARSATTSSPLATPLPYDVQRHLFDVLRTPPPRRGWPAALLQALGDLLRPSPAGAGRSTDATSTAAGPRRGAPVATAAYTAAAVARDQTASIEPDAEGRSAAAAFAAAAAIATSASAARLDDAERAGLCAAVAAGRAVANADDAVVFVDTVGVAALVTAAALLHGADGAAALTALANIAIVLPKVRAEMLAPSAAPIADTIRDIIFRKGRFHVAQAGAAGDALSYTEALVSGTHLLGSLALAKGEAGTEFRVSMATDKQVVKRLQRLSGGLKNGEPEGAARAARRALGSLGVNTWRPRVPGQRGLRILSIDGGGTRAIMAFEMLKELKKATGCEIHELFDIIGGTSTGAIVAASIGIVHKSVEEVELLYRDMIGKVFAKNPVNGPKMLLTRAYYDTSVLETTLQNECGRGVFIDSLADENMNHVFVVSSIMSRDPKELHVFRNYTYPLGHESRYDGTAEAQLWEGLRASSAAPTFFSEIRVNGELHADGAIVANNPTAVALHETKCMFPGVPIELMVSLGNGISPAHQQSEEDEKRNMGWGDVVGSIVASATSTETVHYAMQDLFPKDKYFRFNPTTDSTQIDETSAETLAMFVNEAQHYIRANTDDFAAVAQILRPKTPRSLFRRFRDALRKEIQELENSASHDDLYLP